MQNCLNWMATSLVEGEMWHERSALCCYNLGFRGLGRWHEAESCGDEKRRKGFDKYMLDNARLLPIVDLSQSSRAISYGIADKNQLNSHLTHWMDRESGYIAQLKEHIARLSQAKQYSPYKMLCEYLCELENELLYVRILSDNIKFGATDHHTARVMKDLHKYFECEYDGGKIDFTIT